MSTSLLEYQNQFNSADNLFATNTNTLNNRNNNNDNDDNYQPSNAKLTFMLLFIIFDIGINSSVDYDNYNEIGGDILVLEIVFQLFIQISIFLIFFLTMADTFLFRVGLLGMTNKVFTL